MAGDLASTSRHTVTWPRGVPLCQPHPAVTSGPICFSGGTRAGPEPRYHVPYGCWFQLTLCVPLTPLSHCHHCHLQPLRLPHAASARYYAAVAATSSSNVKWENLSSSAGSNSFQQGRQAGSGTPGTRFCLASSLIINFCSNLNGEALTFAPETRCN